MLTQKKHGKGFETFSVFFPHQIAPGLAYKVLTLREDRRNFVD